MAQARIPPIDLLYTDPERFLDEVSKLPTPLVSEVLDQLKHLSTQIGEKSKAAPTPVELAIANPRYRWMDTLHLRALGEIVAEAVELAKPTIVCMPPRSAKSTTCSVWTPFWALVRDPEIQILFISYEANFARRWGLRTRQLVELYGDEYGLKLDPHQTAADNWLLTSGGGMTTVGAGGGLSGKPADLLICDDLIKDSIEASSEIVRETTWEWWESTAVQRIEPTTAVFVIGTRWHEDDVIGRMLKHAHEGDGIPFELISLPALAEEDDALGRAPGDALWPEHFSKGWWEKRRDSVSPYVWSSVYQQHPSPPGGNMVDPAWWRFYRPSELPQDLEQEIQSWDLSLDAEKKTDSFHCGGVLGRKGALVYIRDAFHEHCGIDKVMTRIRDWNMTYPKARTKLVERAVSGPAIAQMLRFTVGGMTPWPPKGVRKMSKEACLDAVIPDIRSGNVLLPLTHSGAKPKWVQELTEELRQFPRAAHDDYVDMVSQGVGFLLPSARRHVEDAHEAALGMKGEVTSQQQHTRMLHGMITALAKPRMDAIKRMQDQEDRSPIPYLRIDLDQLRVGRATRKLW